MQTFIIILVVIACILLALVVLIQNPKGGGLDTSFASANQIGGVKRTADFLEKGTWGLAATIMVLCLLSAAFDSTYVATESSEFDDMEMTQPQQLAPPVGAAPVEGQDAGQSVPQEEAE